MSEQLHGTDGLADYLVMIGGTPLLTPEQEKDLAHQMDQGREAMAEALKAEAGQPLTLEQRRTIRAGIEARDLFYRSNLRLVVSIAKRYPLPEGMERLDLIQEGNFGLDRAVDKFDIGKGFKFSTYATFWIRKFIRQGLDDQGRTIRIPPRQSAEVRRLAKRLVDGEELTKEEFELLAIANPLSLDKPNNESDPDSAVVSDNLASSESTETSALRAILVERTAHFIAEVLDPRSAMVIELSFGIVDGVSRSQDEISQELGISIPSVYRIKAKALMLLREAMQDEIMGEVLV